MTDTNRTSNQYLSIRKKHLATLREIARDGTVEVGQFKAALQWAISRLDGMPEHWVASPDETSAVPPAFAITICQHGVDLTERACRLCPSEEPKALTPAQLGQAIADACEPAPLPHPLGCECRLCLPEKAAAMRAPEVCGCPYGQCHCDDGSAENGE